MRYAFVQELSKLAASDKNIILLTADLGFTVFEDFAKKFKRQFVNVGICEPNMIGVASGLALSGKIVFAYSIATFATFRTYEYIRNDVCFHRAPVIIVGSGAGLSYGDAGHTHFATEDISLARSLPNMTVLCPADPLEARWAVREAVRLKSPVYLRLGKKGEQDIYESVPDLKLGKGSFVKRGSDFVIIATGNIVRNALEAARTLEASGHSGSVVSMHTVKPIDQKLITSLAQTTGHIITVEEHTLIGGLGSAVGEIISHLNRRRAKFLSLGLPDEFPQRLGNQNYLREIYGLSPQKLSLRIKRFLTKND